MKTLLIMTVGGTDVQLCEGEQRKELSEKLYPELSKLVETDERWSVRDAPIDKGDKRQEVLPEGPIGLCTPKLDAILEYAAKPTDGEPLQISAALILDTRRQPTGALKGKGHAKDPSHAGPVLARRLKEMIKVEARFGTHLSGQEEYVALGDPRDAVLSREVVAKIDAACSAAIDQEKPAAILLAVSAGFPAVRSLVPEIIRLRVSQDIAIHQIDVPDARQSASAGPDRALLVPEVLRPDELFAARRRALDLVRRGHLLGAFGAIEHIHRDAEKKRWSEVTSWTRVLEWLSLWASSLPITDCNIELLTYSGPGKRAVRSALQVEMALRAGNIPSAVHGTVAFFESALWDHLLAVLLNPCRTDSQRYSFKSPPSTPVGFPFKREQLEGDGTKSYLVDTGKAGCTKLVTTYLNKPDLLSLHQAISGTGESSPSPVRDLRNDVAHNVPTEESMDAARQVMQAAKLWSGHNPPQFLCQDLVKNVLMELGITVDGVSDPAKLCEKLISDVEQRILVPS